MDLVAGVSYGDDIKKVKEILQDILDKEPRILKDPTPTIGLMEMANSSINFAFRAWVKVEDYRDLFFELREQIKIRFDEAGVTIPFPQGDVHLFQESPRDSSNELMALLSFAWRKNPRASQPT